MVDVLRNAALELRHVLSAGAPGGGGPSVSTAWQAQAAAERAERPATAEDVQALREPWAAALAVARTHVESFEANADGIEWVLVEGIAQRVLDDLDLTDAILRLGGRR